MISHEVYEFLHISLVLLFFFGLTLSFFCSSEKCSKRPKILAGVASLLIFVAGMGMMARLGIGHGESWPLWIKIKMTVWALLAIGGPLLAKRVQHKKGLAFSGLFLLFLIAIYAAIFQPGGG